MVGIVLNLILLDFEYFNFSGSFFYIRLFSLGFTHSLWCDVWSTDFISYVITWYFMSFHGIIHVIIHVIIYVIIHVVMHMINWGSDSNWENGQNSWVFWESGEFPKFLKESEGGLFFNYRKFLKCLAIREISQIPRHLGNFPVIQSFLEIGNFLKKVESVKFPKYLR